MKSSGIKKIIINSTDADYDTGEDSNILETNGVTYDFSETFEAELLEAIYLKGKTSSRESEFSISMNRLFYKIMLTGAAAIVILLISIFLMEGSLSFNSFLGLGNSYDESTICLLTGN